MNSHWTRRRTLGWLAVVAGSGTAAGCGGGAEGGVGTGGTGPMPQDGQGVVGGEPGAPAPWPAPGPAPSPVPAPGPGQPPAPAPLDPAAAPTDPAPLPVRPGAVVVGPITGFGSVVVSGVRFDIAGARLATEDRASVAQGDLRLGMLVEVQGRMEADGITGAAASVRAFGEIRAPIESIDAATGLLRIGGVQVQVDGATVLDPFPGLSALRVGDYVEVYGIAGEVGEPLFAFRLAAVARPAAGGLPFKTRGVVTALDAGARRFRIGSLTVSYAGTPLAAGPVAEGQVLVVESTQLPTSGTVNAASLAVEAPFGFTRDIATKVEGPIGAFRSVSDFKVSGVRVDASGAGLDAAVAGRLRNGVKAVATGFWMDQRVVARSVVTEDTAQGARFEFTGVVSNFLEPASFDLAGLRFTLPELVQFVPGNRGLRDLGDGVRAEVRGRFVNGVPVVSRVRFTG